jgi:excisionase family DNA binding protein
MLFDNFACFAYFDCATMLGEDIMASALTDPISVPQAQEGQIRDLRRMIQGGEAKLVGPDGHQLAIPEPVHDLLLLILKNLQPGKAISIVPEHQQLTTQRAANILGVSRPFLVKLLENGDIPFHMVGSHRRIYLRDLLDYKRRRDAARHEAINNMARAEMEAGTYDKVVLPEGAEDE